MIGLGALTGGFVLGATLGFPACGAAARLGGFVVLFACGLAGGGGPVGGPGAAELAPLALGGLGAGLAVTLPLRGVLAGVRRGTAGLLSQPEVGEFACLAGALGWLEAGGFEAVTAAYLRALPLVAEVRGAAFLEPGPVSLWGRTLFAGVLGGAFPALVAGAILASVSAALGAARGGAGRVLAWGLGLAFVSVWLGGTWPVPGEALRAGAAALGGR